MHDCNSVDFYLFRHAECEKNLEDVIGGRSNESPLTPRGVTQGEYLRECLRDRGLVFDMVLCSPAVRTVDTLQLALPGFDSSRIVIEDDLQELDQGEWTGKPRAEVYGCYQELIDKDPWHFKPPGGESQFEVALRAIKVLNRAIDAWPGYKVGVFTHGGTIKYTCAHIFNFNRHLLGKTIVTNASMTHLIYNCGWNLRRFND